MPPLTATSPRRKSVARSRIHGTYEFEAADRVFGGEDRNVELLLELDVIVDVLVGERVLVPVKPHLLDRAADPQGFLVAVAPGRVEHHRVVVADRLAHRLADLDVVAPGLRRMDLVGAPAGRLVMPGLLDIGLGRGVDLGAGIGGDLVARRADQAMDRQPRRLAGNVPQRDVAGADRAHRGGPGARPQEAVEALAVERVLTHQDRLQKADQARPVEARRVRRGAEKGVAGDAVIGRDRQQPEIALAGRSRRVMAIDRRRNALPGEQGQADIGDLH